MDEDRIEGFCYCLCGHTAGKHTTADPKQARFACREPGCICKSYKDSPGAAKSMPSKEGAA
ncbi:MAG TPA: hypothetical protein VNI01_02075 [Elusimicrobiota bacterium]|jgi:hypothetical protein|nr:hypothetical protein [Elusimicrobiota bacterium]